MSPEEALQRIKAELGRPGNHDKVCADIIDACVDSQLHEWVRQCIDLKEKNRELRAALKELR